MHKKKASNPKLHMLQNKYRSNFFMAFNLAIEFCPWNQFTLLSYVTWIKLKIRSKKNIQKKVNSK